MTSITKKSAQISIEAHKKVEKYCEDKFGKSYGHIGDVIDSAVSVGIDVLRKMNDMEVEEVSC